MRTLESALFEGGFDNRHNYIGQTEFPNMYAFLARTRDSGDLALSNFYCGLKEIGGEGENVQIIHIGHWAFGWLELIAVKGGTKEYEIAETILNKLRNYPLLDEEDHSRREYETAIKRWNYLGMSEKIKLCHKHGVSIFAARRSNELEDEVFEDLRIE